MVRGYPQRHSFKQLPTKVRPRTTAAKRQKMRPVHDRLPVERYSAKIRRFAAKHRKREDTVFAELAAGKPTCPLCLLADMVAAFDDKEFQRIASDYEIVAVMAVEFLVEYSLNGAPANILAGNWTEEERYQLVDTVFQICYETPAFRLRLYVEKIMELCRTAVEAKNEQLSVASKSSSIMVNPDGQTVH